MAFKDPRRYWRKVNELMGKVKAEMPTDLCYKGKALDGRNVDGAWADMFLKQEPIPVEPQEEKWVKNAITTYWNLTERHWDPHLDRAIQMDEVLKAIKKAPNAKAVGIDEIPMDLVKKGGPGIQIALTNLFRQAYDEEDVPDDWRRGVVVPIPKTGDNRQIENYRGITLLSTVVKTYVSILNKRLSKWMEQMGCW